MREFVTIAVILTLSINSSVGQSRQIVDSLFLPLYKIENSKDLSKATQAKQIINYGSRILPILSTYFIDTTLTDIKSDCQNFYLRKGEVAMILADRIEMMPYATLTGIQNCLMQFCKDNPNWIEYYLDAIRKEDLKLITEKYMAWLKGKDKTERKKNRR